MYIFTNSAEITLTTSNVSILEFRNKWRLTVSDSSNRIFRSKGWKSDGDWMLIFKSLNSTDSEASLIISYHRNSRECPCPLRKCISETLTDTSSTHPTRSPLILYPIISIVDSLRCFGGGGGRDALQSRVFPSSVTFRTAGGSTEGEMGGGGRWRRQLPLCISSNPARSETVYKPWPGIRVACTRSWVTEHAIIDLHYNANYRRHVTARKNTILILRSELLFHTLCPRSHRN